MKIGITIAVIVISLITSYVLLSTKHYAKSQLSNVCNFLNDETDLIPRVGRQAKIHLRMAKSQFSQFRCVLSNKTFHGGLPFTISMHINSDSDEIMILYYGFSFPSPVYYHQSSYFEHAHI
ncbi:hypothetical protein NBRC116188_30430 [Oceaniserpentilla sp. 4NH20-0058]|uniref:hypothetical protein n=1 Tax=Oceaniserpentilla sp. 4NH20-0058 TaxID=3127660 RepID=UPI00310874AF